MTFKPYRYGRGKNCYIFGYCTTNPKSSSDSFFHGFAYLQKDPDNGETTIRFIKETFSGGITSYELSSIQKLPLPFTRYIKSNRWLLDMNQEKNITYIDITEWL